jgi:hypothetical protein
MVFSRLASVITLVLATVSVAGFPASADDSGGPDGPDGHDSATAVTAAAGTAPSASDVLHSLDLRSTIERAPAGPWLDESVTLELLGDPGGAGVLGHAIESVGGRVVSDAPSGTVLAEVPLRAVDELERSTDATIRSPLVLDVRPERHVTARLPTTGPFTTSGATDHVDITRAGGWHDAGFTGAGVRVGVIDFFNIRSFWDTDRMGPEPVPGVTARCIEFGGDCSAEFFAPAPQVGDDHGPAVVEIIRAMAPDAEIYIGRAATESDYYALIDWFADSGVRIVNRSLGSRYDGPGDGRGALTAVADYAVGRDMTWFNSGGNGAIARYYRHPVRIVGDHVAFGPAGTSTWLAFNGCIAPGGVRWANDWDLPPAQRTDYDVFIHRAPIGKPEAGQVVAASTFRQTEGAPPLEVFTNGTACPPQGSQFYLRIQLVSGSPAGDVIEILDYADGMAAHTQAPFSAATPVVDSRSPGVIAVGAIDPPGSGTIGNYSSQGPTNDGRIKPDVAAPSGSTSVTFGATFSGTSASAPVVAGGAALLLGARLAADSRSLGDLVRHLVVDRGAPGRDNVHGTGEFRFPDPPTAAADAEPSRYVPLPTPTRVLDTRPTSPIGPAALIGDRWPGRIVDVPVNRIPGADPAVVTAVAANVTVVAADQPGYTQAFPTGRATLAGFSNSNIDTGNQTRPNFMVIPVGRDGTLSIYSTSGGDLLVDVLGTFEATDGPVGAGRLVDLPVARRVLDTRAVGAPLGTGQQMNFAVPDGLDPAVVSALVVNVTATQTTGLGFVQALPAGRSDDIGRTSTLNLTDGATSANTVIVPVTAAGVTLFAELGPGGSTHLIADVTGYITSSAAPESGRGRFVPVRPGRAFDSRSVGALLASGSTADVRASDVASVSLPSSASAVVWNLTATGTTMPGFLSGWPADGPEPPTSALNWTSPGTTVANAGIIAPSADGVMRVRVDAGPQVLGAPLTHTIVDVFGYFT